MSLAFAMAAGAAAAAGTVAPAFLAFGTTVQPAPAVAAGSVAAGTFRTTGYRPRPLAKKDLPYQATVSLPDTAPHDASGVRMHVVNGRKYDHPVAQAQYGLALLTTYQGNGQREYLKLAIKQARRLLLRRTAVGGAWFYPYRFDFAMHDDPKLLLRAPWYSGMAQGQALSLFARLAAQTGDAQWRQAAAATFDSLLVPPTDTAPWVTHVGSAGYVWIDEYPERPAPRSDLTFNGHLFGVIGLYDYVRTMPAADPRRPSALRLLDGAETTSRQYAPAIRNPGYVSKYCLQDGTLTATYHALHIEQLAQLYSFTHDPVFAKYADDFRRDYPAPEVSGTIHLVPGEYELARFNAVTGVPVGRQTMSIDSAERLPSRYRQQIKGQGVWLKIASGPHRDWWVKEAPGRVWLGGVAAPVTYAPPRPLPIEGAVTGRLVTAGAGGGQARSKTMTFSRSTILIDQTADVDGRESWHVAAGPLAGYWIAAR